MPTSWRRLSVFTAGATGGTDLTSAARAAADGRLRSGNLLAAAADVERLSVVTGIPHPEQVRDLALSGVEVVLDEAVATGQPVVVDCGAGPCVPAELGAVRRAVIARATHVLSVGVPTALGIRRWVDSAGELGECTSAGTGQVIVVWNRMPRGPTRCGGCARWWRSHDRTPGSPGFPTTRTPPRHWTDDRARWGSGPCGAGWRQPSPHWLRVCN